MSVYSRKGRGWMYDFVLKGKRYTSSYYKTKSEAQRAEALRREEIRNPKPVQESPTTPTGMAFLELVNKRLDFLKAGKSFEYYRTYRILARKWVKEWSGLGCKEINREMVERFLRKRTRVSRQQANKELRYLRALFNWGIKTEKIDSDPTKGIEFLPVEKKLKYVPEPEDVESVLAFANQDTRDYLIAIRDTMARVSEINRLIWDDVDLKRKYVVLYTRKKRGGHLTPRKVPMTKRLFEVMQRRAESKRRNIPWVFFFEKRDRKTGKVVVAPYKDRRDILKSLCHKAGVRRFGFHALRHAGASMLDGLGVPIGTIQRILGHENRTTTEIYLHSIGKPELEAMVLFERANQTPAGSGSAKKSQPKSQPNKKEVAVEQPPYLH
jgi:integrase